jgi:hypothetical protein
MRKEELWKEKEQERLRKESERMMKEYKEMETKAINDILKDWKGWVTKINYSKEWQKYVLSLNTEDWVLNFLSEDLDRHNKIHNKYCHGWTCLGWWRIKIDDKNKTIDLYDYSRGYDTVSSIFHEAMKKLILVTYPGYEVNIW